MKVTLRLLMAMPLRPQGQAPDVQSAVGQGEAASVPAFAGHDVSALVAELISESFASASTDIRHDMDAIY